MARFILETDDPSRRIIHLTGHPTKHKHKTNFPDELCKCPGRELCLADVSVYYDLKRLDSSSCAAFIHADGSSVRTNYERKFV